jgi:excisionase family DNA binding protein
MNSVIERNPAYGVAQYPKLLFENLLNRNQLAEKLGISPSYVSKLMAENGLPHIKLGRSTRFYVSEVAAFLERKRR